MATKAPYPKENLNIRDYTIMSIEEIVLNYRRFLIESWPSLSRVLDNLDWDQYPYFLENWEQANWELLVEGQVGEKYRLPPYGFARSPNARYLNQGTESTHQIICLKQEKSLKTKYRFLCFSTVDSEGANKIAPPFDCVNVENFGDKERFVLPLKNLGFTIDQTGE